MLSGCRGCADPPRCNGCSSISVDRTGGPNARQAVVVSEKHGPNPPRLSCFSSRQYRRLLMQQIASCLILDGWIAFQQPRDDFLPVHFHRPFLFQPAPAVSVRSTSLTLSTESIHSGCCSVAYIFEDCCRPRVSENRYASCSQVSKTSVRSASSAMMTWCVHLPGYGSTASTI